MMTGEEYLAIKTQLGVGHEALATMLDITARTSLHYAKSGAPRVVELAMRMLLENQQKPKRKRAPRKAKTDETDMPVLSE
jgi:hypothetical protein